ncbi:uncharacterized protein LOC127844563 [Dreissena polymorpha]|uniref:uncharacterized protein LOC127844563 n=1 Tax=Dreissena polymorpha TaxID=45954 RepID=UPI0022651894|nr:uncharacterized protein LOC127844563 [Dreissena polymorpha]
MAKDHDWELQTASILWILVLFFGISCSDATKTYYMTGSDCDQRVVLGGAVVHSHNKNLSISYSDNINCKLTFQAQNSEWKLMLRVEEMDILDRQGNGICNDALYVSSSENILRDTMEEAGGNNGLCGTTRPSTIYSTGQYLTVQFRTDKPKSPSRFSKMDRKGTGFTFIITAYSDEFRKSQSCGSSFQCDNQKCIEPELSCDRVDNCGDYSDESPGGPAQCGKQINHSFIFDMFLKWGVAGSVGIFVGSLIIIIFCTIALVCTCRNTVCRKAVAGSSNGAPVGTTPTLTNGGPGSIHGSVHGSHHGSHIGNGHVQAPIDRGVGVPHPMPGPGIFNSPTAQGYYPMHPVYPSPHGSVYSAHTQNSAFTRDSGFAPNQFGYSSSVYSSQAPSYIRSHTPTSSKSGKSHHSNNSVTYTHNTDKVMVNL